MSNRERFLIGGVGGLAPVLVFLLSSDFSRFFSTIVWPAVLGYSARALILFLVGGFVVSLYREEEQRMKIFQLGLGAPAMIAGYLAGSSAKPSVPVSLLLNNPSLITTVLAQSPPTTTINLKRFTLPPMNPFSQFMEGLTGARNGNVWFVIAASFSTSENAKAYAKTTNDNFRQFHADVYSPFGDSPYYNVVIGAHLSQLDAKALKERAIRAGLPKQTYFKTFPNLPAP